jgi:hypothetical protein
VAIRKEDLFDNVSAPSSRVASHRKSTISRNAEFLDDKTRHARPNKLYTSGGVAVDAVTNSDPRASGSRPCGCHTKTVKSESNGGLADG